MDTNKPVEQGLPGIKAPYDFIVVLLCLLIPAIIIYKAFDKLDKAQAAVTLFEVTSVSKNLIIKNTSNMDFESLNILINGKIKQEYNQVLTRNKNAVLNMTTDEDLRKIRIDALTADKKIHTYESVFSH
jgi:hypothetical protein